MIGPFPHDEFLGLHERLTLAPGPSHGEGPRRDLLRQYLAEHGLSSSVDAAGNLLVRQGPAGPWSATAVLDAHLDVVERGYALEVRRTAEHLQGLGVGDNQVAVAMLALALVRLQAAPERLRRPLLGLFSVGEEGLGNLRGVRHLVAEHAEAPWLLVSFDGSIETYSMTGLGSRRYRLAVTCPGGHSWGSFGSPNAIEVLLVILSAVRSRYQRVRNAAPVVISFNLGTIRGGEGINSIARQAEATFEFRSVSEALLKAMDGAVRRYLAAARRADGVEVVFDSIGERPATAPVAPARIADEVLPAWSAVGLSTEDIPMSTNINPALAAGWPAVCVGLCACRHPHREDEVVDIASLPTGWDCLDRLCARLMGG